MTTFTAEARTRRHGIALSAILVLLAAVGCKPSTGSTSAPSAAPSLSPPRPSDPGRLEDDARLTLRLCNGRARCQVRRRRDAGGTDLALIDLSLKRSADSVDECNRNEYWLVGPGPSTRLLATDCDEQWGADSLGHAETNIDGSNLTVTYEEMHSSDRCEGYDARLALRPLAVTSEARWDGARSKAGCRRENEIAFDWVHGTTAASWSPCVPDKKAAARRGVAIPKFVFRGEIERPVRSMGSCALQVEGISGEGVPSPLRLRALVVGSVLLVEVRGSVEGTLTVWSAIATAGDGAYGNLACQGTRQVSRTVVALPEGRVQGVPGVLAKILARDESSVTVSIALAGEIGRMAVSFEDVHRKSVGTADVGPSTPADALAPLARIPPRRCVWEDARVAARQDLERGDAVLSLEAAQEL